MSAVTLFRLVRDDIKVDIEVRFEDDSLVIEGYDIGKSVEEYWGDSDYEYGTKVMPDGVQVLYSHFKISQGDRPGLLKAIAAQYNTNKCYSDFLNLLERLQIRSEGWSWT